MNNAIASCVNGVVLLQAGRVFAAGKTADVLTYQHLTAVYETEIYVDLNDITGALVVTALSSRARLRLREAQRAKLSPAPP